MKNSVIYIVGATVLGGGAYLFLKNKKAKDLSKLAEIGGATTGGTTLGGTTSGGTTPSGTTPSGTTSILTTPSITEPVKIDKDLNLDTYNLQNTLEEYKKFEEDLKKRPQLFNSRGSTNSVGLYDERTDPRNKEFWLWWDKIGSPFIYLNKRQDLDKRLAKLGYKYDNGLLVKI